LYACPQTSAPRSIERKPRDDEIDVYGVTHRGHVRTENQDHFLICSLRRQIPIRLTSLPDPDRLMADPDRLAFIAMVACHAELSDGLTRHVSDLRIRDRLRSMTSARQVCEDLLPDALAEGGTDNITLVVGRPWPKPS
jgi:serine/threonine protein phosphatase PrpC